MKLMTDGRREMSELKPCEICGDSECEDAAIQYYIDKWQEAEAFLLYREAEIQRLLRWQADACVRIDALGDKIRKREDYLRQIAANSALCMGCSASWIAELALKEESEHD
jgi:hypothetical protein